MIDFHSHIVHNIDDGAETIEDSIKILKQAQKAGFDKIILTPHYMPDYYMASSNQIQEKIAEIQRKCKDEEIDIELYQANEIYIVNSMVELLQQKEVSSINHSRYVLFELPMNEEPLNLLEVVYRLLEDRKIPVIAHPERYRYIQKEPNKLQELIEIGVLFQANYGSIIGQYGKEAQKTVKQLLQHNYIHFLGTDVHKTPNIYRKMDEILETLEKIINKEKIEELTTKNIEKVIRNEEIEVTEPSTIKKGFLQKIFR